MGQTTSQSGIDLIKKFEGCVLTAYKCPAGVWTIGYGHTGGVVSGQTITQAQAETYLKSDLSTFERAVNSYVTVILNQNQFDALVSFAYNCGSGALKTSTLLKKLNTKDYTGAADQFDAWVKANGKTLQGLVTRRTAEKALFLKDCSTASATPAAVTDSAKVTRIKVLQTVLNTAYKAGLVVDGKKGAKTDAVIKAHTLKVTSPILNNAYVGWLQTNLTTAGYATTVDNKFGPGTEAKVKSYQSAKGLTADGKAGLLTVNALVG